MATKKALFGHLLNKSLCTKGRTKVYSLLLLHKHTVSLKNTDCNAVHYTKVNNRGKYHGIFQSVD